MTLPIPQEDLAKAPRVWIRRASHLPAFRVIDPEWISKRARVAAPVSVETEEPMVLGSDPVGPVDVWDAEAHAALSSGEPRWKQIIRDVCHRHGLTKEQLTGRRRLHRIVLARHEAMYLMHVEGSSLPLIGRRLGGRDHTTVLHGVRTHRNRLIAAGALSEQEAA